MSMQANHKLRTTHIVQDFLLNVYDIIFVKTSNKKKKKAFAVLVISSIWNFVMLRKNKFAISVDISTNHIDRNLFCPVVSV